MNSWVAGALVFCVAGAVLVLEILAGRLLAPYVGLSLQTYTAIIGVVLGGISVGAWIGGRLADAYDPRRLIGPLLVLGGALAITTLPTARYFGDMAEGRTWPSLVLAVLLSFFLPAVVLSAIHPLVVKLQLGDLHETGRTVGRLSAIATAGAIAGTFMAGFVLLPEFGSSEIIIVLGLAIAAAGIVLTLAGDRSARVFAVGSAVAAGSLALFAAGSEGRCDEETAYFCANVDTIDDSTRALRLDTLTHGVVNLRNPRQLGFPYARRIGDVVDAVAPPGEPIQAFHIGGGAFTLPRYIAATRPGSENLIFELDPGVVRLAKRELDLRTGPRMRVVTGDARVELADLNEPLYEIAVGDAFAGMAVPWHLTTREALEDVRRSLAPRGIYAMNMIDHGPRDLVKAELRTLEDVFRHVAVVAAPGFAGGVGGSSNYVLLASDSPLPLARLELAIDEEGGPDAILSGAELARLTRGAETLTDDYAPADQLLTR